MYVFELEIFAENMLTEISKQFSFIRKIELNKISLEKLLQ